MAIQSFQLDPAAQSYTDDQIVGKVNAASAQITRAGSVAAAARPLGTDEVLAEHIKDGEIANTHIATGAAIAKTKLGALAIGNSDMVSTAAKDNLDALADTARGYIKTSPTTGEFKIISVQRNAAGKMDVDYDDVPA